MLQIGLSTRIFFVDSQMYELFPSLKPRDNENKILPQKELFIKTGSNQSARRKDDAHHITEVYHSTYSSV